MPHAARITDNHTCPAHGAGPVDSGSGNVNIGFQPAARMFDTLICAGAKDAIAHGSSNVFINHREAARIGDPTMHGGVIVAGCPTVNIGTDTQSFVLGSAAGHGTPFCEICESKRREREERERKRKEAKKKGVSEQERDPAATDFQPPPDATTEPNSPLPPQGARNGAATPFTPSDDEVSLAKKEGNSIEQRAAREKVVRDFYERFKDDGLGQQRADQDLGVGGAPPRPNKHPLGFGIDLSKPLEVVKFPPPEKMSQYVRRETKKPGNFFDPVGEQSGDSLGLNADPAIREKRVFAMPRGEGLRSVAGPIRETWTDPAHPLDTKGGGVQLVVPNSVKRRATPVLG